MVAGTLSPYRYVLQGLAALVAASVADVVVGSAAAIAAAFEEGSIEAHEADLVVVTAALAAPPTATAAHQTHRAGLATAEADTVADLTVIVGTMEAAAEVMAVVTTIGSAVAAVDSAALIGLDLAATQNQLAPGKVVVVVVEAVVAAVAAVAVVGIATETSTDETTPGSALTRVAQDMKGSGNFVGINCTKTRLWLVLRWVYRNHLAFVILFLLSPSSTRVSKRGIKVSPHRRAHQFRSR